MQRLFRLSLFVVLMAVIAICDVSAQLPQAFISGRVAPGAVRILQKDTVYIINNDYVIGGTLIIEPGTDIYFYDNGRLIDSVGGRIIADGDAYANYTANPDGINPIATPGSPANPNGFSGYADLDYFLYSGGQSTVTAGTTRDLTVHPDKYDYLFNVKIQKSTRRIVDLQYPGTIGLPMNPDEVTIPFEQAVMFQAARLQNDPANDINLNIRPWQRIGGEDVDLESQTIRFYGQSVNPISREWGHIIILPGARAAFFRNCLFDNFRKDVTVDRFPIYDENAPGADWSAINTRMLMLTNGAGGAISTFSSRTWLLDCEFTNNMARHRGGALQLLQTPMGFPKVDISSLGYYPSNKNPNITNSDGSTSSIITGNPIPFIDNIDGSGITEPLSDYDRQAYDDGRLASYLGRMRNLRFTNNYTQIANIMFKQIGPIRVVTDDTDNPADFPLEYGDGAYGGAIYISGAEGDEDRSIEIGLGVNHSLLINGSIVNFPDFDTFEAAGNKANNYQSAMSTPGARGGAIYVGRYTSLIVAGSFNSNETYTKFLQDDQTGSNSGYYSMGGGIYAENTLGRLQVRGGPSRENYNNETEFIGNKAGAGGAIFVDGNTDPSPSPIIGGSDATVQIRNYGYGILFQDNEAASFGGALYSKRQFTINGAGGVEAGQLMGYGGKYPVRFLGNMAGYSGGAITVNLPNGNSIPAIQRSLQIVRASFRDNVVGLDIADLNKPEIRGGGAIYTLNGDLAVVKGVEFIDNTVYNGNGGAVAMVHPESSAERFFLSDLDVVVNDPATGVPTGFVSTDGPFTYDENVTYPADTRMLTRFIGNEIIVDQDILDSQSGTGTTQQGQGTFRTSALLHGTSWLNNDVGFAVGYDGTIIKFTQGGSRWEYQTSGTRYRLTSVEFVSNDIGFVGGDRGIILKTTDGGRNWNMMNTPTVNQVNDIVFIGTNLGFAACDNGTILMTSDAGNTWTGTQPESGDLHGVFFVNSTTGFAVGERGLIIKTTDGGANWSVQFVPGLNTGLNHVNFISADIGFIAGNGGVFVKTVDGGDNWEVIDAGVNYDLQSSYFTNQSIGYVVGNFGVALKTEDGGDTWTALDPNSNYSFYDVFFPSTNNGFMVGDWGTMLGTTDAGATWSEVKPGDESLVDVVRYHQEMRLPENGVGLGGAIYILDSVTVNRVNRVDSVRFNRVRIQDNRAFTGAAIYSDNFDLKLIFNKSLITNNVAWSTIGEEQNAIGGPVRYDSSGNISHNYASSDLAGAIIYGEIQGPLPSHLFSVAANSIYDNEARFLIRLPDAPNTKGVLAGQLGIGFGGTDTLRGNYWGRTEANVNLLVENVPGRLNVINETFFLAGDGESHLTYEYNPADPTQQGPFEFNAGYAYNPVPLLNDADENTADPLSIPEKLLMSGNIYDMYDKGTDIKTADYSKRRMTPIEDFSVGIPPMLRRFDDMDFPSNGKYVRRWVRDPFSVEATDDSGALLYPFMTDLQDEYRKNEDGDFYHPIGYPLYLETHADYDGLVERSNHDQVALNESVFFIINETTSDYIRVNLRQFDENAPNREIFRVRAELVPDSSQRNPNTTFRRTTEGLLNLGSGSNLLGKLADDAMTEDQATLQGRKYEASSSSFATVPQLFSNREFPTGNNNMATFFAGERFRALPVNVGDNVRIISRTVLWSEGVVPAYDDGISFRVVESTEPPVFTGNIVSLSSDVDTVYVPSQYPWKRELGLLDTIIKTEFLNRIWVTEDRRYPVAPGVYSVSLGDEAGRDSILTVTAIDSNSFYDPRAILTPDDYAKLTYTWRVAPSSGLRWWLQADQVKAGSTQWQNPRDDAEGYLMFRGIPTNPYVVPGGEIVEVGVSNYPPHWRTVDILRDANVDQDDIDQLVEIFPSYFNAETYDNEDARYVQQDTIDFGSNFTKEYQFELFVVDDLPRILEDGDEEVVSRYDSDGNPIGTVVEYVPSIYKCDRTDDGRLIANLTDKLRFQMDLNTDDELEDEAAENNWDFRFGRTSYGFQNVINNGGDIVVIDTAYVYDEDGNIVGYVNQSRPIWMQAEYLATYDGDEQGSDALGVDFTTRGQLNIRIDAAEAMSILTPDGQANSALNTDTTFNIVVNDGHGGMIVRNFGVFVNVAPVIITESLPAAKEDFDYNLRDGQNLLDSNKMIKIFDPNFGQSHLFELIYSDYPDDEIPKDPCYEEAGVWDVSNMKTTPDWLKINTESGLLYGTPRVTDAPKDEMVTVLVTDEDGLTVVKQFELRVDSINHIPRIAAIPEVKCVDLGGDYMDTLIVVDHDLLRLDPEVEEVTITIESPENTSLTIEPSTLTGTAIKDSIPVIIYSDGPFTGTRDNDGRITIIVRVDDGEAFTDFTFRLRVSDSTNFISTIRVENSIGAFEELQWGTGNHPVTTGDGTDLLDKGLLDANYCEYELPPLPTNDVFDARWTIPLKNGIDRSVYPTAPSPGRAQRYRGSIQAGGVSGGGSAYYPVTLSWDNMEVPDMNDTESNPNGSTWYLRDLASDGGLFNINMRTGEGHFTSGNIEVNQNGDQTEVIILSSDIEAFVIWRDLESSTPKGYNNSFETNIVSVSPNPVGRYAQINYELAQANDVAIDIVDVLGNVVKSIVGEFKMSGQHSAQWDGADFYGRPLSNGAYMVRMTVGGFTFTYPIAIVK